MSIHDGQENTDGQENSPNFNTQKSLIWTYKEPHMKGYGKIDKNDMFSI